MHIKTRKVDVELKGTDGEVIIEKHEFEIPEDWSDRAALIAKSKYATDAENSAVDIIERVVDTITEWGIDQGYFDVELGENSINDILTISEKFSEDLTEILVDQRACFNSPALFNLGVPNARPQCSACFVLGIEDNMESILEHGTREGLIFRDGSGAGVNISKLRGEGEKLSTRGASSGALSFMRIYDAVAQCVRSGGKNRRAAKLVCMNADHPDIFKFIDCKLKEEQKAKILMESGISPEEAYSTVSFQNANHSVRVTDEFMEKVKEDGDWKLINRKDKQVSQTIKAKDLFKRVAEVAWETGDPGIQFHDRMNKDNPVPSIGEIESTNPCFTGNTFISTEYGEEPIRDLVERALFTGELTRVYTKDGSLSTPVSFMCTGENEVLKVTLSDSSFLMCTLNHHWHVKGHVEKVRAENLKPGMVVWQYTGGSYTKDNLKEIEILEIAPKGIARTYNLTEPKFNMVFANNILIFQCSEFSAVNSSSCNLASLNLLKYYNDSFDWELFREDIKIMITSMDILIDKAYYPMKDIEEVTRATRPLGLGFTNLGALLMQMGLPYDSDEARQVAANITKTMTSQAYIVSSNLAAKLGVFKHFEENKEINLEIARRLTMSSSIVDMIKEQGLRNSQLTLLAPTGTIGLLMDCETYGIEPLFARHSFKNLVGGGVLEVVPSCVRTALEKVSSDKLDTEVMISRLSAEKKAIFDTANDISWKGHIDMMAACQEYISSAISKTINMPSTATVEEVMEAYMYAWEKGVKAITIYRDGSKSLQPMTHAKKDEEAPEEVLEEIEEEIEEELAEVEQVNFPATTRMRLPDDRKSWTHKFNIVGHEGYLTVGMYDNGSPGELFIRMQKQGSFVNGMMDSFAKMISLALQYGVPLSHIIDKLEGDRFEPAGITNNEDIRIALSLSDYIGRHLKNKYIDHFVEEDEDEDEDEEDYDEIEEEILKPIVVLPAEVNPVAVFNGDFCVECGGAMFKAGSCSYCSACGVSSGCS